MKKHLVAAIATVGVFSLFAPSAHAVLLGSYDAVTALNDLNADVPFNLYDLKRTGATSLNTPIDDTDFSVMRRGGFVYFTDTVGIRKQAIGSSTATTLRATPTLEQVAGDGDLLLVNNTATKRSLIYDVVKKKSLTFTPRVGLVAGADFALNGRVLVMVAKNTSGQQKLFVSQGAANTVRQYDLPSGVKKCAEVAVSPKGTKAAILCEDTFGGDTIVTMNINGQTFGRMYRKVISTFLAHSFDWLTERKLVVGGYDSTGSDNLFHVSHKHFVVNSLGKITNTTTLGTNPDELNPSPTTVLGADFQLQRNSSSSFYYSYSYLGTDAVDTNKAYFGTSVSFFDTETNTETVLVNDEKYNLLTEQPNPVPTT